MEFSLRYVLPFKNRVEMIKVFFPSYYRYSTLKKAHLIFSKIVPFPAKFFEFP